MMRSSVSCGILIVAGLAVSGHLFLCQLGVGGNTTSGSVSSPFATAAWQRVLWAAKCDPALDSSIRLGLPFAGWGVIYYLLIGSLLVLGRCLGDAFEPEARLGALTVSVAGGVVSVALVIAMLAGNPRRCLPCFAVHAVNVGLVFALRRMTGRAPGDLAHALGGAARYILAGKAVDPAQARWILLAFSSVGLFGLVLYQWAFIQANLGTSGARSSNAQTRQQVLAEFRATPKRQIPLEAGDARLGPAQAPAQLVVFSDFQCPACKSFSERMPAITGALEGNVQVVFKHFPLDQNCNRTMRRDLHPQACAAAYAAEAARKQGKFWQFHDALFTTDLGRGEEALLSAARQAGLDLQQFDADRKAAETISKVRSDIELGISLGVNRTPTTFWNGREVLGLSPQVAQLLFAYERSR